MAAAELQAWSLSHSSKNTPRSSVNKPVLRLKPYPVNLTHPRLIMRPSTALFKTTKLMLGICSYFSDHSLALIQISRNASQEGPQHSKVLVRWILLTQKPLVKTGSHEHLSQMPQKQSCQSCSCVQLLENNIIILPDWWFLYRQRGNALLLLLHKTSLTMYFMFLPNPSPATSQYNCMCFWYWCDHKWQPTLNYFVNRLWAWLYKKWIWMAHRSLNFIKHLHTT